MVNLRKKGEKYLMFFPIIILLLSFVLLPPVLSGNETGKESGEKTADKNEHILTIEEGLISLNANDASLKEIIEEISRKMELEIVGSIDSEEMITLKFDRLSIRDALKKLTKSYGFVMDSGNDKKITRIIVLPEGLDTAPSRHTSIESEPPVKTERQEPFKFEFDP